MIEPDFQKHPPLILIVDDEKTLRLVLRRAMEREGFNIAEANNGEQCLKFCQQQLPDMVLLDAMMPEMDGFICCEQLKALLGEDCPPVLMITALNDRASVDRAFAAGATDYVTKPIHWAVLRQRVRRLLASQWAIAELRRQIERERLLTEQLEERNQELRRLASLDGLTQIANRRCFDETLKQEWNRLMREQAPLSLILSDIDFFKAYNDTYGHQAGDECLRQVVQAIQQAVRRPADLVSRYGGEEFAVILPCTPAQGAVEVAKTIGSNVRALQLPHAQSPLSPYVTLSVGVTSTIPQPQQSLESFVAAADAALYQAKWTGRDRTILQQLD